MATRKGSETITTLASIMPMTVMVSSAHTAKSVRGVGWCSMVRLAPRIHRACAVGAISTGKPASTPTTSPRPTPAAARPPAMQRARSWTSPQVWRTGMCGSPVTMPVVAVRALWNIFSVNLLKATSSVPVLSPRSGFSWSAYRMPHRDRRAHTVGERLGLGSVMSPRPNTADYLKQLLSSCQTLPRFEGDVTAWSQPLPYSPR
ncbi:Uncharacterised protein [Mycobacterium tuberculosis]|nr:Uncharacterised protein [Mycobacterium tuberculosis]